jgi:hypothetical protein
VTTDQPSVIDGLDVNEVKDGLIVYDPERDRVHYLNATAGVVFTMCDGEHSGSQIAEVVSAAFELDGPPRAEVDRCLAAFANEGLLR